MNAEQLFKLAPLGSRVAYSDGQSRPPERFKRKLADWQRRNSWGFFIHANPGSAREHDSPRFTLHEAGDFLQINRIFGLDSVLEFKVTPVPAGAILSFRSSLQPAEPTGREISYVWEAGPREAQAWAVRNRYNLAKCGLAFVRVGEDGALQLWNPVSTTAEGVAS